jgi:hypothetical protein
MNPRRPTTEILHRVLLHGAIVIAVLILTFFTHMPDFDLWARLAVGSLVFQTGHVLKHDIFSYLPTKDLWVDHEWGSGVVLYGFVRGFGDHGLFVVKGLLLYAIFLMVLRTIGAGEHKKTPSPLYFVFLGYALFPGIASLVRSQMFTYLFFIIWIYALETIRRGGKKFLWVFPVTMLFWVNMHGGFVAGIGLVLLYALGDLLNRRSLRPYLWIGLSILPVTLINPYGFALWRAMVEAYLMPRPFIPEWNPISLGGPRQIIFGIPFHHLTGFMLLVGMTALVGIRSLLRKEKPDWTRVVVLAGLLVLGVRHQRHVVFFTLAASALMVDRFDGLLDPFRRLLARLFPQGSTKIQAGARWGFGFLLPALVFILIIPKLSYGVNIDYRQFPVGSLEFIKQNGLTGNLATSFDWGSYASWKLYPQCKVMLDGRYEEVYPDDVFDLAIRFAVRKDAWWEALTRFPTDIVVLPKFFYSRMDLAHLPGWRPVYEDFVSVVLLPRDKLAASYLRPDFTDPAYAKEDMAKPVVLAPRLN